MRQAIQTENAPTAIGTYSQAVRVDNTVYVSGQIPLDPTSQQLIEGSFDERISQVFKNLQAVAEASGAKLSDAVKLNVYMTDLQYFDTVNQVMSQFFSTPYPARAAVQVAALPKGTDIEIDAVLVIE